MTADATGSEAAALIPLPAGVTITVAPERSPLSASGVLRLRAWPGPPASVSDQCSPMPDFRGFRIRGLEVGREVSDRGRGVAGDQDVCGAARAPQSQLQPHPAAPCRRGRRRARRLSCPVLDAGASREWRLKAASSRRRRVLSRAMARRTAIDLAPEPLGFIAGGLTRTEGCDVGGAGQLLEVAQTRALEGEALLSDVWR